MDKLVAIVTGANSGIGLEVAKSLASKRCCVILACRNKEKGEVAESKIRSLAHPANVKFLPLDLASFASIREFVRLFHELDLPLHILINNAGVFGLPEYEETEDGFEYQVQ